VNVLGADLVDLLSLPVIQRSALALIVAGTFLPLIGVLIIGFDILTVRFAVMHVALLGLALGLWVGIDPLLFALVACGLAGVGLAPLASRPGGLSGPMGFVMTVTIAAALLVLSVSGVNANSAFSLLWGTILATRPVDLALLVLLAVLVLGWYARYRDQVGLLLFDREVAMCSGVAVGALTAVALVAISLSIAASIRLTGALLIDSLTILPALAARNLATSLRTMVRLSIAIGIVGNLAGLLVALILDQPPGPVLVLVAGAITTITYLKKDTSDAPALH
jgi:zinc transport system permease protein